MIFSEAAYRKVLGTSKEDFIESNLQDLTFLFPKEPSFKNLKSYYTSNAYSAKLLSDFQDFELSEDSLREKIEPCNIKFFEFFERIMNFKLRPLRILCFGGQYFSALLLSRMLFDVVCMDFSHELFQLFRDEFSDSLQFVSLEKKDQLEGLYDIAIASNVLEHHPKPRDLIGQFSHHMERDAVLYCPMEYNEHFEHIGLLDSSALSTTVKTRGFAVPFNEPRIGLFFKHTTIEFGVERFRFTDKAVVGEIQKEMFKHTINSIFQPETILNIGGPRGEFCKKSISVDICGNPHIKARGECLPIKSNSIDLIYSCHSLEHMKDTRKTLREWVRVLRPKGLLTVIVPILPFHKHGDTTKLGAECFEEHTEEEFREIFERIENTSLLQFGIRKNKTDLDVILRKDS